MNPLPDGNGHTTEIGSVPDLDPESALDPRLLARAMPWVPELPRRDAREGMLERVVCEPGQALPSADRASALHALLDGIEVRGGPPRLMKVALAGPVVLARNGRDSDRGLAVRLARALAAKGWEPILQFDEPGTTEELSPVEEGRLADAVAAAREAGAHVAIHDCGAVRGAALLSLAPDAISVDATRPIVPLIADGAALARYLRDGGSVLWGIAPTDGGPLPGRAAVRALLDAVGEATGDRELVRRRGWLSPACGLGTLTTERAEDVRRALGYAAGGWT